MEDAITAFLLQASGLTALVGRRITWAGRPQAEELPALVLHKIDSSPEYADEGEVGLFSARLQVDCWARGTEDEPGYEIAKNVARQVMACLSGADFTHEGTEIQGIFAEDEQDSLEEAAGAEELDRVRLDFTVWHT